MAMVALPNVKTGKSSPGFSPNHAQKTPDDQVRPASECHFLQSGNS